MAIDHVIWEAAVPPLIRAPFRWSRVNADELRAELAALHPACYGWAMACCDRDRDEACETLQVAYVRMLSGLARFSGQSELRTWVFGVIRMVARERRRDAVRHRERERTILPTIDTAAGTEPDAVDELVAALHRLSKRQREVLELVFYHDFTIEHAADVMHVSIGTARTHYERGKVRLRELLHHLQRTG